MVSLSEHLYDQLRASLERAPTGNRPAFVLDAMRQMLAGRDGMRTAADWSDFILLATEGLLRYTAARYTNNTSAWVADKVAGHLRDRYAFWADRPAPTGTTPITTEWDVPITHKQADAETPVISHPNALDRAANEELRMHALDQAVTYHLAHGGAPPMITETAQVFYEWLSGNTAKQAAPTMPESPAKVREYLEKQGAVRRRPPAQYPDTGE